MKVSLGKTLYHTFPLVVGWCHVWQKSSIVCVKEVIWPGRTLSLNQGRKAPSTPPDRDFKNYNNSPRNTIFHNLKQCSQITARFFFLHYWMKYSHKCHLHINYTQMFFRKTNAKGFSWWCVFREMRWKKSLYENCELCLLSVMLWFWPFCFELFFFLSHHFLIYHNSLLFSCQLISLSVFKYVVFRSSAVSPFILAMAFVLFKFLY